MNQLLKAFFLFTPLAYAWLWSYRNILRPAKKIRADKRALKKPVGAFKTTPILVDPNLIDDVAYVIFDDLEVDNDKT